MTSQSATGEKIDRPTVESERVSVSSPVEASVVVQSWRLEVPTAGIVGRLALDTRPSLLDRSSKVTVLSRDVEGVSEIHIWEYDQALTKR